MIKNILSYRPNALGWMVYIVIALAGFIDYGLSGGIGAIIILTILFIAGAAIQEMEKRIYNVEVKIDLTGNKKDEEDNYDW